MHERPGNVVSLSAAVDQLDLAAVNFIGVQFVDSQDFVDGWVKGDRKCVQGDLTFGESGANPASAFRPSHSGWPLFTT
jgi:hypothetical protein